MDQAIFGRNSKWSFTGMTIASIDMCPVMVRLIIALFMSFD